MKRTNNILIAALAGIALSLFAGSAQAQYKPTGDDGITASPKLRQQLDEYRRNHSTNSVASEMPQMACPKCKDEVLKTKDWTARGANKPYVTIVRHLCEGCGTEWSITGHGKAKQSVATHTCSSCGAESAACCNTTKGSTVATKGMEKAKSIEVAPLK
ncbi:MAG: hypothetical protein IPK15_26060 [Verrucomicrobia bacterium]|jgi:hypothetical protein|nr:hypothetical protein [Verrucomicrobiota bacterium]